ncbi:MAG: TlpA family protein disulfide reductase [Planctomycetota bacterium]|nr:MAG: TlpA family protein disulfide reductase [Planctomycetota bacterium]
MRRPHFLACCLCSLFALGSSLGRAQDESSWRGQVDVLIDRWSNDLGRARVERALAIVDEHLAKERNRKDGEAWLTKARLLLARPHARRGDAHYLATQRARDARRALEAADVAASTLLAERRQQALALACVASEQRLQRDLSRLELVPGSPRREELLREGTADVARRRAALERAVGSPEKAAALIATELRRVLALRDIDRLGTFPLPIGQDDIDGQPVDLSAYRGKVLLILFWSSKIGDASVLGEIARTQKETGAFEVLAINLDETREAMQEALAALDNPPWRHCFDGRGIAGTVARAWGVRALPSGVLLDRSGRVRYVDPWRESLRLAVEELLARDRER